MTVPRDENNVPAVGGVNPSGRFQGLQVDADGNLKTTAVASGGDAFARSRVTTPFTVFDSKQIFDNQPLFWDDQEVSGGGTTSTHSTAKASTTIAVGAATAGNRTRQTFRRFNYQPGKSQLIILTASDFAVTDGITKQIGFFDDDNGLFFESNGTSIGVVQRSKTSGSVVNTRVAQADWNVDPMDGNGSSGITLDFDKTQIYFIDFEWLGVGRVRFGFFVDGVPFYCHEFLNANNLSVVYMSTPNLPLRYVIENDGTGAADELQHICSTVITEGGTDDNGVVRYASTNGTHLDANAENTTYALIGIRLKSTHVAETIKLITGSIQLQTGSNKLEWTLKLNPTVAGTFTYSDQTNSAVQIATGATANTVTGGINLAGGYLESGGQQAGSSGSRGNSLDNAILLGSKIDGTVDSLVVCVTPVGGSTNVDVEGGLTWREVS